MLQFFPRKSGAPLLLATAALCASAEAAVLEFESTRRTVTPFGAGPETFTQQPFDGVPSLTNVTVYGNGLYRSTGGTFDGVEDSLNGRYEVGFFRSRDDGVGLYAGFSWVADSADGWQGGTGNYAEATALTAYAGYSRATATASIGTTTDFGYIAAPAITTPAYVLADVSPAGQPAPDTSDLTIAALGYHDVSFAVRAQSYSYSPDEIVTSLPGVGPGAFTSQRHVFGDANVASFEWTGADGAFLRGELTFLASPNGWDTVPVPDTVPADDRSLLAGYYRVTEGRMADLRVTGGYIAFSGLSTYDSANTSGSGTGLVSLSAYGWIQTQPVPEPETWAMFGVGGLLLAGYRTRQCRASRRA